MLLEVHRTEIYAARYEAAGLGTVPTPPGNLDPWASSSFSLLSSPPGLARALSLPSAVLANITSLYSLQFLNLQSLLEIRPCPSPRLSSSPGLLIYQQNALLLSFSPRTAASCGCCASGNPSRASHKPSQILVRQDLLLHSKSQQGAYTTSCCCQSWRQDFKGFDSQRLGNYAAINPKANKHNARRVVGASYWRQ